MPDTRTDLVTRLRALPHCPALDDLIARAQRGDFHDFKSEHATPKMELTRALANLATKLPGCKLPGMMEGCAKISAAVMAGDYDESPDAEDESNLGELIAESGLPPELFKRPNKAKRS